MRVIWLVAMMCFCTFSGYAQVGVDYDMLNYMATRRPTPKSEDKEGIQREFQIQFIKRVFLDKVFKSGHLYYSDEDDTSDYDVTGDYDLVNEMMINQFADILVDSQFLDLSDIHGLIGEIPPRDRKPDEFMVFTVKG